MPARRRALAALVDLSSELAIECPAAMRAAVSYVLSGEYESGFDGENLDVLDIGANVGAFALWAVRRWPGSRIRCYEPNPGTFAFLKRNTAGHASIVCCNAALYPGARAREPFFSRYDGDGEAGLASYAGDTFVADLQGARFEVDVIDPAAVESAQVVKIDVEGGEGAILAHLDLSRTGLVLLEYQNGKNRAECRAALDGAFDLVHERCEPWDPILNYRGYRSDLKGDVYGVMFWRRRA
jgi:FkbM family methyltransferase